MGLSEILDDGNDGGLPVGILLKDVLNRYSCTKLQVDGAELSNMSVSGVFDAGDSRAFADAIQSYLPVNADYSQNDVIRLRLK